MKYLLPITIILAVVLCGCSNFTTQINPAKSESVRNTDGRSYDITITPSGNPLPDEPAPPPGRKRVRLDSPDGPPVVLAAWPSVQCSDFGGPPGEVIASTPADPAGVVIDLGDGKRIQAPAGSSVRVKATPVDSGIEQERQTANNSGIRVNGNADKLVEKLQTQRPETHLSDGGYSKGGGTAVQATFTAAKAVLFFYILGGLLIVGGIVVAVWLKQITLGIALAIAGVTLIACGVLVNVYPWVFLVAFGVLGLLALIWFLAIHKAANGQTALEAIIAGVHTAPPAAAGAVKASISVQAGANANTVKDLVTAIKRDLGLTDANAGTAPAVAPVAPVAPAAVTGGAITVTQVPPVNV